MDDRVVPIRPEVQLPVDTPMEPRPSVVEFLEHLLADARAGRVQGVACVHHGPDWRAQYHIVGSIGGFSMQGALSCVMSEVTAINMSLVKADDA